MCETFGKTDGKSGENLVLFRVKSWISEHGDCSPPFLPQAFRTPLHRLNTFFPHTVTRLDIQLLPDFGDVFTDREIEFDGFLNLFYRMDGGRVVFSAELLGYLREA